MGQDPVIEFPDDFKDLTSQLLHQIHDKGLIYSQAIVYNMKTKKHYSQVYPSAPGHAESSKQDGIYYISQCNACNRKSNMFCIGNAIMIPEIKTDKTAKIS